MNVSFQEFLHISESTPLLTGVVLGGPFLIPDELMSFFLRQHPRLFSFEISSTQRIGDKFLEALSGCQGAHLTTIYLMKPKSQIETI